jgi:hypothetical protein
MKSGHCFVENGVLKCTQDTYDAIKAAAKTTTSDALSMPWGLRVVLISEKEAEDLASKTENTPWSAKMKTGT